MGVDSAPESLFSSSFKDLTSDIEFNMVFLEDLFELAENHCGE